MGLISLVKNVAGVIGSSVSSEFADQYQEVFTCDSLGDKVLLRKGAARNEKGRNKGSTDVITQGSIIFVPEGMAVLLVDGGQVIDFTDQAGYYRWDSSTSPSVLSDKHFGTNLVKSISDTWDRMRAAGEITKQQRIYFVNLLEMRDNNFGTATPLPYPDPEYRNIYVRINGTFSFVVENPVQFFKFVTGNVAGDYTVEMLMGTPASPKQPRQEFLDHMTEVLNRCGSEDRILFSTLPSKQSQLRKYMAECLDEDWLQNRGIIVQNVAINAITPDDKSRERIEQVDQAKMFGSDPSALAAQQVLGTTQAMNTAAANANGAVNGFMGMGMVGGMQGVQGGNQAAFNFLGQQQQQQAAAAAAPVAGAAVVAAGAAPAGWTCECGQTGNTGKFCSECGKPQPAPAPAAAGWDCECGQKGNTGKFCSECGKPQPAAAPAACPKCGYTPADGKLGKFCPECGEKIE